MKYLTFLVSLFFLVMPALGQDGFTETEKAAMDSRLQVLKSKERDIHITVYPIILNEYAMPKLSAGAALLLENAGVKKIDIVDTSCLVTHEADIAEMAKEFQAFVIDHPFEGEYAYLLKILGDQNSGGERFYSVLLDEEGGLVFADYHTKAFFKPKTVLGCVNECVKVLCDKADFGDPGNTNGPHGEWYEYFKNQRKNK